MTGAPDGLDLDAYLARIGYTGERNGTGEVLCALHLAHATTIAFENLDILLGRPIRLDLASLQAKLVRGGRGGYCFEHNGLFAAVLETLGFEVVRIAARVRLRVRPPAPRTHMALIVAAQGRRWLADVGFGGEGLLLPLAFEPPSAEQRQYSWSYRLVPEGRGWVVQSRHGDAWTDLYAFTEEPQQAIDFEPVNYYLSTHPDSKFVRTLTAQLPSPQHRVVLRDRELLQEAGGRVVARRTLAEDELPDALATHFGLHFPPGTRFGSPRAGR